MGNRSASKVAHPVSERLSHVFAADGEPWTAHDVAEYLLVRFAPAGPAFTLASGDEANNLFFQVGTWPAPPNVAAGLSQVIRRQRGMAWSVTCWGEQPQVAARSVFSEAVSAGGVAVNPNSVQIDLNLDVEGEGLADVEVRRSAEHVYDEIHVLGEHVWVCGAVALAAASEPLPAKRRRKVLLHRTAGPARVTLFDGGHEIDYAAAIAWLAEQRRPAGPER